MISELYDSTAYDSHKLGGFRIGTLTRNSLRFIAFKEAPARYSHTDNCVIVHHVRCKCGQYFLPKARKQVKCTVCPPEKPGAVAVPKPPKVCRRCEQTFIPLKLRQVFCSRACFKLKPKSCVRCATVFQPSASRERYCMAKCELSGNSGAHRKLPERKCKHCNKTYQPAKGKAVFVGDNATLTTVRLFHAQSRIVVYVFIR